MQILPRPFGQVLSDSMNGLARTWRALISPALYAFIPVGIVTLWLFRSNDATEFLTYVFEDPDYLQSLSADQFIEAASPFVRAVLWAVLFQAIASVFVYMASHHIVASDAAGIAITGSDARKFAIKRFPIGLASALVAMVAIIGVLGLGLTVWLVPLGTVGTPNTGSVLVAVILFFVLVGPGLWLSVSLSMLTSVVAIERKGVFGSLRASLRLVRARWWPTLAYLALVGLLGFTATQLIQLVAIPLSSVGGAGVGVAIGTVLGIVAQGLIIAAIGAMYTGWYIDLRARKEDLATDDLG